MEATKVEICLVYILYWHEKPGEANAVSLCQLPVSPTHILSLKRKVVCTGHILILSVNLRCRSAVVCSFTQCPIFLSITVPTSQTNATRCVVGKILLTAPRTSRCTREKDTPVPGDLNKEVIFLTYLVALYEALMLANSFLGCCALRGRPFRPSPPVS
ncbi:hypothetical protein L209DRAFT_548759 [Thermothelomyces heterothallicus CBS 203.75]